MDKRVFFDDYGNCAVIEKVNILAYRTATKKEVAYRLKCFSLYNNNFVYLVSVYETENKAMGMLKTLSCDTWKEEPITYAECAVE